MFLTYVFYVTVLIMRNMCAHRITLAKTVSSLRLVLHCVKERKALLERQYKCVLMKYISKPRTERLNKF